MRKMGKSIMQRRRSNSTRSAKMPFSHVWGNNGAEFRMRMNNITDTRVTCVRGCDSRLRWLHKAFEQVSNLNARNQLCATCN